jgi:hypothetical protein
MARLVSSFGTRPQEKASEYTVHTTLYLHCTVHALHCAYYTVHTTLCVLHRALHCAYYTLLTSSQGRRMSQSTPRAFAV